MQQSLFDAGNVWLVYRYVDSAKWGDYALSDVRTVHVEEWLGTLPLANASKAKIRSILSAIFNHAMCYEWMDRNPITLVRHSAKRKREPDVLSA